MAGGEPTMVPRAEPRSYYGQPILKQPVWSWEVPWYLFFGGLAGASAALAAGAEQRGNERLARRSWAIALAGLGASPPLLISDLGRPQRFFNMLRVFKVTSPMSVGSWILSSVGVATGVAALHAWTGALARPARLARPAAGLLGPPLASYTGALLSDTAVPVWHEARRELPFVFVGSAAASAGAAATLATPSGDAGPARRLAAVGAAFELAASKAMEARLGELGQPYGEGASGRLRRAADALTVAGGLLAALGARRPPAARLGSGLLLAGSVCKRWSVFKAGFASAADPAYVSGPQRARVRAGEARGAEQRAPAPA